MLYGVSSYKRNNKEKKREFANRRKRKNNKWADLCI